MGVEPGADLSHALVRAASAGATARSRSARSAWSWSGSRSPGRTREKCSPSSPTRMFRRESFRFLDFREMHLAAVPVMVNRVTYTGDLGYEIWVKPEYQRRLYEKVMEAGEEFGIVNFGMRALLSMRLEKNWPTWYRELRPIYGPFEADAGRFVDLKQERLHRPRGGGAREGGGRQAPPRDLRRRCGGRRRARRRADLVRRQGDRLGHLRRLRPSRRPLACAGLRAEGACSRRRSGFEIEILGERRPARIQAEPLFDPEGARMRG